MLPNVGEPVAPGVLSSGAAVGAAGADFGALRCAAKSARCSGVRAATSASRSNVGALVGVSDVVGDGGVTGAVGGAGTPSRICLLTLAASTRKRSVSRS